MNRDITEFHPPRSRRTGAAAADPVLDALPTRFLYAPPKGRAFSWIFGARPCWSEQQTSTPSKLTVMQFGVAGDDEQAASLYRRLTSEHDPAKWPKIELKVLPTTGIILTVYGRVDGSAIITLRNETNEGARTWPLIEPVVDITGWLRTVAPKPNSSADPSASITTFND